MRLNTIIANDARPQCEGGAAAVEEPVAPAREAVPEPSQPARGAEPRATDPRVDHLPPFKVLLHNDDENDIEYVTDSLIELFRFSEPRAVTLVIEAHMTGVSLVMVTHRERAELAAESFRARASRRRSKRRDRRGAPAPK